MFSNLEIQDLNISQNDQESLITLVHTHMGVTITSDAKWKQHIENITVSVSRQLNALRKLNYQKCQTNLEKNITSLY